MQIARSGRKYCGTDSTIMIRAVNDSKFFTCLKEPQKNVHFPIAVLKQNFRDFQKFFPSQEYNTRKRQYEQS